ncbi:hypothetical protein SLA2020_269750 [Shorea laevis]
MAKSCWVKGHPARIFFPNQLRGVILAKEPVLQAIFARAVAPLSKAQAKEVTRVLPDLERLWDLWLRAGRQIAGRHIPLLAPQAITSNY